MAPLPSVAASWGQWTPCFFRQVAPLWKALATKSQLARQVITLLYTKLQLRPAQLPVRQSAQAELVSLLVRSPHPPMSAPCPTAAASPSQGPVWCQGYLAGGLTTRSHGVVMLSPRVGWAPPGLSWPSQA